MNRFKLFATSLVLLAFVIGWGIGNQHTTALERADLPLDVAYTGGFQVLNEPPSNGQTATDKSRQRSARSDYHSVGHWRHTPSQSRRVDPERSPPSSIG